MSLRSLRKDVEELRQYDSPIPLEKIMGPTWHRNPAMPARYTYEERLLQGPWWVRFGRWLRRQPQPTVRGSSRTTGI